MIMTRQRNALIQNKAKVKQKLSRVRKQKRLFDTVSLLVAAPVVLPVGIVISIAVRFVDGAPVLYRQERTGMDQEQIEVLKFRTMHPGDGRNNDSGRITKLGGILRSTSLDELPQLWNVMKGDMSLVGPRPLYPEYLPFYTEEEQLRHKIRPGITGLSQISGRNALRWTSRLAKDVQYVQHVSLLQDIKILVRTVQNTFSRNGVAAVPRDTGEPLNVERSYPRDAKFALRKFNILDVPLRVAWMNHNQTRQHMRIPFEAAEGPMTEWYHRAKVDVERDDFVVYQRHDDEPVAMLGLKSEPGSDSGTLYVFVAPDRAGGGIGTASMKLLLEWARKSRYTRVRLGVGEDNRAAWKIYENLGFVRLADPSEGRRAYEIDVSRYTVVNE